MKFRNLFSMCLVSISLGACNDGLGTSEKLPFEGDRSASVAWTANREKDVNSIGGGYRVYYFNKPSVNTTTAPFVDVPYVSGPVTPTTATIKNIAPGTYYIRVVAYSGYNPLSVVGGNLSTPSSEISFAIPR